MELIQSDLMRMWITENARADKTRNDKLLLQQIAKNIRENCTVLSELGLGMPILASMKATIDKASITGTTTPITAIELDEEEKD